LAITHLWSGRKARRSIRREQAPGDSRAPLATGVAREGATVRVVAGSVRAAPIAGERGETNADDGRDREDEGDRGKSLQDGGDERGWRVTIEKAPGGIERSGSKPCRQWPPRNIQQGEEDAGDTARCCLIAE
jgi:hypothetical protein